jgi:hypothetical protein
MANVNRPIGLRPVKTTNAANWNEQANVYYVPAADASAYYIGDVVKSAAGADANGVPQIAKAVGTDVLRGVVVGILASVPYGISLQGATLDLANTFAPATKTRDYYLLIADDPSTVFEVQGDATATNQVAANANKNCSLTIAVPTAPGQWSATVVNSSTIATTSTLNIKLMGLVQKAGNGFGAYSRYLCMINQHEFQGATAGI